MCFPNLPFPHLNQGGVYFFECFLLFRPLNHWASTPHVHSSSFSREACGILHIHNLLLGECAAATRQLFRKGPWKKKTGNLKGVWSSVKIWFQWIMIYILDIRPLPTFLRWLRKKKRRKFSFLSVSYTPKKDLMNLPQQQMERYHWNKFL